jgi:hypothetical protein
VVRRQPAKLLLAGSIPARTSIFFRKIDSVFKNRPKIGLGRRVILPSRFLRPEEVSMSIGFRARTDEELHVEFGALNDTQLIETGKMLARFAAPTPGQAPDMNWLRQLKIARQVWRERHPK